MAEVPRPTLVTVLGGADTCRQKVPMQDMESATKGFQAEGAGKDLSPYETLENYCQIGGDNRWNDRSML